jgi:anthranilate synthase component 2/para-aminobenzoate synthetase component 2
LVVAEQSLPEQLTVTAWTEDAQGQIDAIMGLKHRFLPLEGVQFHPEAILTQSGLELLANFIKSY